MSTRIDNATVKEISSSGSGTIILFAFDMAPYADSAAAFMVKTIAKDSTTGTGGMYLYACGAKNIAGTATLIEPSSSDPIFYFERRDSPFASNTLSIVISGTEVHGTMATTSTDTLKYFTVVDALIYVP